MQPGRFVKLIFISLPLTGFWTVGMGDFPNFLSNNLKISFPINQVLAQSIVPEPNSTNTLTNSVNNRVDITGGQQSGDGRNLFHSFTQFNVPPGQIANFVSNNSIQNIFSRVVGGQPSVIEGLIKVTGGNSNLFILNPSGIIFGSEARLDVPGAFTATTATGIGFNSGLFNSLNSNDYNSLSGEPNSFLFSTSNPGNIVNSGELTVSQGQTLTLIGGNVINTGTLNAPAGQITIAAIEGNNLVRISQTGYLLNLEIETVTPSLENNESVIIPLDLPKLLTGNSQNNQASSVNILSDGSVELTNSNTPFSPQGGGALISGFLNTRNTNFNSSSSNLPQVNIIGNNIHLFNSEIDASGVNGGGIVRIGSNYQENSLLPTASRTLINDQSTIIADGLTDGNGGRIIIGAKDSTEFFGNISAQGFSNPNTTERLGGFATIFSQNNLNIAGNINLKTTNSIPGNLIINAPEINIGNQDKTQENINLSQQTLENLALTANVFIEAKNSINIGNLTDNKLNFPATTGTLTFTADADKSGSGNFTINSGNTLQTSGAAIVITGVNLLTGDIITQGGNLDLTTTNNGGIRTENLSTSANTQGGNITLKSDRDIITNTLSTRAMGNGTGGNIYLNASNRIQTNSINTSSSSKSGDITFTSLRGDIILEGNSYSIDATSSEGSGGNILVNTPRTLTTDLIDTRGKETGGNIILNAELKVETKGLRTGTFDHLEPATGNIEITSDEINFTGGENSIQGQGQIVLQPATVAQDIEIAGQDNNSELTLNLTSRDLNSLENGFKEIIIGGNQGNGTIFIAGNIAFKDPVIIQSPQGIIASGIPFREQFYTVTGLDNASLKLSALENITLGNLLTNGGNISITSESGTIYTEQLSTGNSGSATINLTGTSENQRSGNINISALGQIETGEIRAIAQDNSNKNSNVLLNSQDINLISRNGGIRVNGQIFNSSLVGDSIAIELLANRNITTGDIKAYRGINLNSTTGIIQSGNINSAGIRGGGNIFIIAGSSINTGRINASSSDGKSGNISLNAGQDIDVVSLRGEGETQGGDIGISTHGLFRATGIFNSRNQINASISSVGGEKGGSIVIQQGGDHCSTAECGNIPFSVGNPLLNGTAGAITDGNLVSLLPTNNSSSNSNQSTGETQTIINQINSELKGTNQETQTSTIPPKTENTTPVLTDLTSDAVLENTSDISSNPNEPLETPIIPLNTPTIPMDQIASGSVISSLAQIDTFRGIEFSNYLGSNSNNTTLTDQSIRKTLNEIYKLTGYKTAIIYVSSQSNQLELRLILPDGQPIFKSIPVPRETVLKTARTFSNQIRSPENLEDTRYKENGKQLYKWLIEPLESQLEAEGINTLVFSMDTGLRTLPLAALYDGKQFLLERYSLGLIPSLSLTDTRYVNIKNSKILAMGASNFPHSNQLPLPAVPMELDLIINHNNWQGKSFLNENFTVDNLTSQRSQNQFSIVHLATHGEFQTGGSDQSYIQFWDQKLRLNQLRNLKLNQPPVELLVLSACTTAVGDEKAELGFAGLAVQAGVKSALASLWYVSDAGTLGLMNTFYQALSTSPIKAEALRQAQLGMLQGKVRLEQGYLINETGTNTAKIPLPPEIASRGNVNLSHPFYWAGFTLIGSPW
ncbi:Toxin CdiA [Planktothrix rubescens]|nr:Toxin CdiA [Planktothrix rubescens]